jgi:two-component system chemotaxis response regulator CheB
MPSTAPARPARVLIVDDSPTMRSLLRSVINFDSRLEVAGAASDGASALRAIDSVHPDLVLLDVEMPVMDGMSTLKQMKAKGLRIPVIMCSALTQRGAKVTIEALASGASDYVTKPSGQPSRETALHALAQDLIPRILALTDGAPPHRDSAAVHGFRFPPAPAQKALPAETHVSQFLSQPPLSTPAPAVVLIGVSTGGPAALDELLPLLPAGFPLPVLIVQHMPELFTKLLAERLNDLCHLPVREATNGEAVRSGNIYIARGDWHLEVCSSDGPASGAAFGPSLRLTREALENHCRPAADVLFRTAVAAYGSRVLAVVLTGMGHDGLAGSRMIREHGGTVIVQDRLTSTVWGMPGAVAEAGLANCILPLSAIAPEILRLAGRGQREAHELRARGALGIGGVMP